MEIVMIIALLFANIYIYIESFNLCRHLLIIDLLLSDQRHQSISGVSGDWTPDLLFNYQRFYQLSQLIDTLISVTGRVVNDTPCNPTTMCDKN